MKKLVLGLLLSGVSVCMGADNPTYYQPLYQSVLNQATDFKNQVCSNTDSLSQYLCQQIIAGGLGTAKALLTNNPKAYGAAYYSLGGYMVGLEAGIGILNLIPQSTSVGANSVAKLGATKLKAAK